MDSQVYPLFESTKNTSTNKMQVTVSWQRNDASPSSGVILGIPLLKSQ